MKYYFVQIVIKKIKRGPSNTPNKNGNQQKGQPLMLFENNSTLQKWHITHFPPKIEKYDTHKKWCLTKMAQLVKKYPQVISQGLSRVIFKTEFLNLL